MYRQASRKFLRGRDLAGRCAATTRENDRVHLDNFRMKRTYLVGAAELNETQVYHDNGTLRLNRPLMVAHGASLASNGVCIGSVRSWVDGGVFKQERRGQLGTPSSRRVLAFPIGMRTASFAANSLNAGRTVGTGW